MMLCRKPFTKDGAAYPCGQCMPCRFNKRREWTNRLMLESMCHPFSCFVTLTYRDSDLPRVEGDGTPSTLVPKHLQDWLKRYRNLHYPEKLRFYAVGEYGDTSGRPHYHAMLFNVRGCEHGITRFKDNTGQCCDFCKRITDSWGFGNVFTGSLSYMSASYIAGYTTKKMTNKNDIRMKVGNYWRYPEFSRMSRDGAIGGDYMWEIASDMIKNGLDDMMADVPSAIRRGGKMLPFGRTLKRKLRVCIGRDANAPQEVIDGIKAELSPVREAAFEASEPFSEAVARLGDGRVAQIQAKNSLFRKFRRI